jgi:CubicO group peptidase (beta-lactamase class C family)
MKKIFFAVFLFFIAKTNFAQSLSQKQLNDSVERFMKASVAHAYFSGSILIAKEGKPIFSKGYGMANYEHQVPNTVNTVFLIGSLTKQFTSTAIMQLVEQDKLKITDSLGKYLDNCPKVWTGITIKHLLTHTSGIFNFTRLPEWDEKHKIQPYTVKEVLNLVRDMPLQFTPGEKHKYSNTNYTLLGLIIERVSGKSYYDFIKDNILKPAQMQHSGGYDADAILPNKAEGYYTKLNWLINAPYENISLAFSAGSLYSTVGDMLLWDQALHGNKILSKKSLEEMCTPYKDNYGYGLEIKEKFDKKTISHGGSINGFSNYLLSFPKEKITIIVLSNSDKASAGYVAHMLSSIVFNKPYTIPKMGASELLSTAYEKGGVDSVLALCRKLKEENNKQYKIDVLLLDYFGYDLMDLKKIKDAIKIFTYTIEENPTSSYAHGYLGEAYLNDNNYKMAIMYFEKALALDPSNEYAKKRLKKISEKGSEK